MALCVDAVDHVRPAFDHRRIATGLGQDLAQALLELGELVEAEGGAGAGLLAQGAVQGALLSQSSC